MKTDMLIEMLLGTLSLVASALGLVAQTNEGSGPWNVTGLLTQFGGLGFAVWLVYYHTTKTIPDMQREHRQERDAIQAKWLVTLETKRAEYMAEMKAQREAFEKSLERIACRHPG